MRKRRRKVANKRRRPPPINFTRLTALKHLFEAHNVLGSAQYDALAEEVFVPNGFPDESTYLTRLLVRSDIDPTDVWGHLLLKDFERFIELIDEHEVRGPQEYEALAAKIFAPAGFPPDLKTLIECLGEQALNVEEGDVWHDPQRESIALVEIALRPQAQKDSLREVADTAPEVIEPLGTHVSTEPSERTDAALTPDTIPDPQAPYMAAPEEGNQRSTRLKERLATHLTAYEVSEVQGVALPPESRTRRLYRATH